MIPTAKCKDCGRSIIWVQDEKGTKFPLDPSAPVYTITFNQDQPGPLMAVRANPGDPKLGESFVSHFKTCPDVKQFSKGART